MAVLLAGGATPIGRTAWPIRMELQRVEERDISLHAVASLLPLRKLQPCVKQDFPRMMSFIFFWQ